MNHTNRILIGFLMTAVNFLSPLTAHSANAATQDTPVTGAWFEAGYSMIHNTSNSYVSSSGEKVERSGDRDLRLVRLGLRYAMAVSEQSPLSIEPNLSVMTSAKSKTRDGVIAQAGLAASYAISAHSPFVGITINQVIPSGNSELKYQPALGYQIGYRYRIGRHSIGANYDLLRTRSANAPSVNDQQTSLGVVGLTYGLRF